MNITSKSRYGLKIMLDLVSHRHEEKVSRRDIILRQGIPAEYLDQIMMRLRTAGLVKSLRGRKGGYQLGRTAEKINIFEVFSACEDQLIPVLCLSNEHDQSESSCAHRVHCLAADPWQRIYEAMTELMSGMTLSALSEQNPLQAIPGLEGIEPSGGVKECRSGEKAHVESERRRLARAEEAAERAMAPV